MSSVSSNSPETPHNAPQVYKGKSLEAGKTSSGQLDDAALLEAAKKIMDEFEKESVMEDVADVVGGGKEKTEEEKKKEKLDRTRETKQALQSHESQLQVQQFTSSQEKSTSTFNTLVSQLPRLKLPEMSRFPMGKDGIGNPWLKPSLATALFQAWLEVLPIMMETKMAETQEEVKNIERSAVAARNKASATMEMAKLNSQKLMLEAIDAFVQAGVQVAQMVSGAVVQVTGQVINAGIGMFNAGMNAGAGMMGGVTGGGGAPNIPPIDTKGISDMVNQGLSAGQNVSTGVIKALTAKIELLVGQQDFMKQMWEFIGQSADKLQQSAAESRKNMSELFSSFIQAMLQFIQQEQIHAIKSGGYG